MKGWLLLAVSLLALALVALGCGPSSGGGGGSNKGATAGMCQKCGSTNLDVERHTERSAFDGSETEVLTITCRDCGYSWTAPGGIR